MMILAASTMMSNAVSATIAEPAAASRAAHDDAIAGLPEGLSLVGLDADTWRVYVVRGGVLEAVPGVEHPRSTAHHGGTARLAYVSAGNRLRERDLDSGETVDLGGDESGSRYTQPHYSADGRWLFAVEMPEGKSRRTVIVGFDRERGERHAFVRKRTAQFEPFLQGERFLYYTTALCVDDCGRMIWELWRRDMSTAEQIQLTLTNAVATQPHASDDGWLYFSGDADGGRFHIWRMRAQAGAEVEQLTSGEVRDSEPATDARGRLHFLRKTREGTRLMRLDADGAVRGMALGVVLRDLRNLEIGR